MAVTQVELRALMAERDSLERERQFLLESIRHSAALDDLRSRLGDFTERLTSFAERLRHVFGSQSG